MAHCPSCGRLVETPRKTWNIIEPSKRAGKKTEYQIGLFDCPSCGPFREVLSKREI